VEPADRTALALDVRIAVEHVRGEVPGVWVIHGVHADRGRAVVLGHVHRAAQAHLQAGPGTAATAEEVHDQLIVLRVEAQAVLGLEVERVIFTRCGHVGSPIKDIPPLQLVAN